MSILISNIGVKKVGGFSCSPAYLGRGYTTGQFDPLDEGNLTPPITIDYPETNNNKDYVLNYR